MSGRRRVLVSWLVVGVSVATMLAFGVVDGRDNRTNAERAHDIGATIACPQCVGQSVVESDVAIAREIRAEIGRLVVMGYSDDDIRARFSERYGDWVILTPSSSGVSGLVWVIPVIGLVVGVGLLAMTLNRWRRASRSGEGVSEEDLALVAGARDQRFEAPSSPVDTTGSGRGIGAPIQPGASSSPVDTTGTGRGG